MRVGGDHHRTAWRSEDGWSLKIIDQRHLPHRLEIATLRTLEDVVRAISEMALRGAPLIGVAAAYGVCFALRADPSSSSLESACARLAATRPTAVNLAAALRKMRRVVEAAPPDDRVAVAYERAAAMADEEAAAGKAIGEQGLHLIEGALARKGGKGTVNVLTHCNAGWLATLDWGTALAPIYLAHQRRIAVHVWVDETRPRNQGATLTAWELLQEGVPHTVITDNAGGHLMQHGLVDLCLVGSDRTTRRGDVCNKIGTYLKALAAKDNGVPFYAAVPLSSIDWSLDDGVAEIPIEERDPGEVTAVSGRLPDGTVATVQITPEGSRALNHGFDVTPARLVTGILTERGVCPATEEGLRAMWPAVQRGERCLRWVQARRELLKAARELVSSGLALGHGTSGNASVRLDGGFLITPTAVPYESMAIDDLVELSGDGVPRPGQLAPSSEWRFHRDIYRARAEAGAIVHAHPLFCTSLACLRRSIPAVHYMVAAAGGDAIRCADYATFGSVELSHNALKALAGQRACLLANHGMIAFGATAEGALALAVEVENLAAQYWHASQLGKPVVLEGREMRRVLEKFKTYGQRRPPSGVAAEGRGSLADHLLRLERLLLNPTRRARSEALASLLAEDFVEVGSSGHVYDKRAALDAVNTRETARSAIEDFKLRELSPGCVMVRYRCTIGKARSLRSSIWVQRDGGWQIAFHQGTSEPPKPLRAR